MESGGKMVRFIAAVLMLGVAQGSQGPIRVDPAPEDGTLYVFFSPENPFSPAAAKTLSAITFAQKGRVRARPVLLVEDWGAWKKPTQDAPLYRTVRELGGRSEPPGINLPVYDLEGLRLARSWKISRLP